MDPILHVVLLMLVFGLAQYSVDALPVPPQSKGWVRGGIGLVFLAFCLRMLRVL